VVKSPIYEFRCDKCGRIMEESLPMTSKKEVTVCIHCNEYGAHRILSQSTFVLKGGGWYSDAYNKKVEKIEKTKKEE